MNFRLKILVIPSFKMEDCQWYETAKSLANHLRMTSHDPGRDGFTVRPTLSSSHLGGGGVATKMAMLIKMGLKKPMGGIMSATSTFYPACDQNPKCDLCLNQNKWFCCQNLTKMCGLLGIYCFSLDLHVWFGKDFMTGILSNVTLSIYPYSGPALVWLGDILFIA